MPIIEDLVAGKTFAEALGITEEMGRAVAELAARELEAGRLEGARDLLEGLVLTNPHDAAAWCLLSVAERRRGLHLASRFYAETALQLAPDDRQVRLVHAEALLARAEDRPAAEAALRALEGEVGHVGERARALLAALPRAPQPGAPREP